MPPAVIGAATVTLPWTAAVDLEVSKPADAMGQFFAESFARRTGRPLAIVVGDCAPAALVALASPGRPSLYLERRRSARPGCPTQDVAREGRDRGLARDRTAGTPPPRIKAPFPTWSPKCRARSTRPVQGRLPLLRIGWAMIRPRAQQRRRRANQ